MARAAKVGTGSEPKPMGRPSGYSVEIAKQICTFIAAGAALYKVLEDNPGLPPLRTVQTWLAEREDFQRLYARAREDRADLHVEEIIQIADTETDAAKARNRIDARKWHASKMMPRKYGEKLELAGDPERPLIPVLNVKVSRD